MSLDFSLLPRFRNGQARIFSLLREWAVAYKVPEAAIEDQIRTAHAWCNANPRKAPKKDAVRFLFNWMGKANKYGNLGSSRHENYHEPETKEDMTFEELIEIRKKNLGEFIRTPKKT